MIFRYIINQLSTISSDNDSHIDSGLAVWSEAWILFGSSDWLDQGAIDVYE